MNFTSKDIVINIHTKELHQIIELMEKNKINLDGSSFWSSRTKSRFIESLLIRIPITSFYIDISSPDMLIPIDGFERLNALMEFMVSKTLVLEGLEILTELEGVSYSSLGNQGRRVLNYTIFIFNFLEAQTPFELRKIIVKRVNESRLDRWVSMNTQNIN